MRLKKMKALIESIEIPAPVENVGRINYSSNVEKYVRYFVM